MEHSTAKYISTRIQYIVNETNGMVKPREAPCSVIVTTHQNKTLSDSFDGE